MPTQSRFLDLAIAVWAVVACVVFVVWVSLGSYAPELEQVGRCVYVVVIATGVVGLAIRAIRNVRR